MSKFVDFSPRTSRSPGVPADLVIRAATLHDLPALARIAAEREGEPIGKWEAAFEHFYADAMGGESLLLVAVAGGAIAGYGKAGYFARTPGAPTNVPPAGFYLTGVIVDPHYRRRGLGLALTRARLEWIQARSPRAYYFANERNRVTIELHQQLGFVELTRDFSHPQVRFEGGAGILFVCELDGPVLPAAKTRTA